MKDGCKLKLLEERNLIPFHSYQSDAIVRKGCPEYGEGSHVRGRASEERHKGIPVLGQTPGGPNSNSSMQTHAEWGANKSSLEACRHLQGYHLIDIGKM